MCMAADLCRHLVSSARTSQYLAVSLFPNWDHSGYSRLDLRSTPPRVCHMTMSPDSQRSSLPQRHTVVGYDFQLSRLSSHRSPDLTLIQLQQSRPHKRPRQELLTLYVALISFQWRNCGMMLPSACFFSHHFQHVQVPCLRVC